MLFTFETLKIPKIYFSWHPEVEQSGSQYIFAATRQYSDIGDDLDCLHKFCRSFLAYK